MIEKAWSPKESAKKRETDRLSKWQSPTVNTDKSIQNTLLTPREEELKQTNRLAI